MLSGPERERRNGSLRMMFLPSLLDLLLDGGLGVGNTFGGDKNTSISKRVER